MRRKILFVLVAVAAVLFVELGCKEKLPHVGGDEDTDTSMAEYRAEAEQQITAENLEDELNLLEEEIEADLATPE